MESMKTIVDATLSHGVAFVKSIFAVVIERDVRMLLLSLYGVFYFFGLLPSKLYAIPTISQTTWGTSARASSEIRKGESILAQTFHVGHLVLWYSVLSVGIAYFFFRHLKKPYMLFIAGIMIGGCLGLYIDFGKVMRNLICGERRKVDALDASDVEHGGTECTDMTGPSSTVAPSMRSAISPESCPMLQYLVSHYDADSNSEVISVVRLGRTELNPPIMQ